MPKKFYTEKDIQDLFNSGVKSLQVTDDVVLTELAYEKANRLGMQLVSNQPDNPPSAPVRPYLSNGQTAPSKPGVVPVTPSAMSQPKATQPNATDLEKRIHAAVIARLGNQVDAQLLDNIIHRVVKGIGLK